MSSNGIEYSWVNYIVLYIHMPPKKILSVTKTSSETFEFELIGGGGTVFPWELSPVNWFGQPGSLVRGPYSLGVGSGGGGGGGAVFPGAIGHYGRP